MSQKDKPLFVLSIDRVPGGYSATARIATADGHMIFSSSVKREGKAWRIAGFETPKAMALDDVLNKAAQAIEVWESQIPGYAKKAVTMVRGTRELALMAQEGDRDAIVGLRYMAGSPDPLIRKAVRAQRLFRE